MHPRIKWTERHFEFGFPAGIYPELIERLRGVPARLDEHCRGIQHELLTRQHDGRWSIQENVGHLLDLESLVQQRIEEYRIGASVLHAADMSNRKTYDANHNAQPIDSVLNGFRIARTKTVESLENLDAELFSRVAKHPRLNVDMRLADLLFFSAEHDDFHLTRIFEIRQSLTKL
jgi:hypothetical protein